MTHYDCDLTHPDPDVDARLQSEIRAMGQMLPDGDIFEEDSRAVVRLTEAETRDAALARASVLRDGLCIRIGCNSDDVSIATAGWA